MRSLLAVLGLSLLLAACSNPFQPSPGASNDEDDGASVASSASSSAMPAAMERIDVNAKAAMGE